MITPKPTPSFAGSDLPHPQLGLAASPLWIPLHSAISTRMHEQQQQSIKQQHRPLDRSHIHIPTVTMPSTLPSLADFLVTVSATPYRPGTMKTSTTRTMTVAQICLTTDHEMDAILAQQSSRIVKCAQKYGPDRVTILLMVQNGHLSCLQTLEHFLLETMSALDPIPVIPTPRWQTSRGIRATATTRSTLAPVSVWGIPNVIACHSPEDTTDYLFKLLAPSSSSRSSATVLSHGQISQEDHVNTISRRTWLSAALATTSDNPLFTLQDATCLEQSLGTIQNTVLATPAQLQNTCLLTQRTSQAIHDFFNTDQPI